MIEFREFPCGECGSTVKLLRGSGRTREHVRGYRVPIPDDFDIPTCTKCGEVYVLPEVEKKLHSVLNKTFLRMQAEHYRELVDILVERHGVTQRDIVRACAITPSYLSHVMAGKRQASTTLTRLLEAFVADNSEFERHLANRPWSRSIASVPLYVVKHHRAPNKEWRFGSKSRWVSAPANDGGEPDGASGNSEDAA